MVSSADLAEYRVTGLLFWGGYNRVVHWDFCLSYLSMVLIVLVLSLERIAVICLLQLGLLWVQVTADLGRVGLVEINLFLFGPIVLLCDWFANRLPRFFLDYLSSNWYFGHKTADLLSRSIILLVANICLFLFCGLLKVSAAFILLLLSRNCFLCTLLRSLSDCYVWVSLKLLFCQILLS